MHDKECLGVLGHHKGELVQSAWKWMNKSCCEGVSMSSNCAKEGMTRLYARHFQGMIEFQGMLGNGRVC